MIFYGANDKIIKATAPHDPDAELFYGFIYKPTIWLPNTVYRSDKNLVIPSVFNGFYYTITSNGISHATDEPNPWPTVEGDTIINGSVEFTAVEYNLWLGEDETLTASTWSATDSVTIKNDSYTSSGITKVQVGPIPSGITEFTITNSVTKNNNEIDNRSIKIKVKER